MKASEAAHPEGDVCGPHHVEDIPEAQLSDVEGLVRVALEQFVLLRDLGTTEGSVWTSPQGRLQQDGVRRVAGVLGVAAPGQRALPDRTPAPWLVVRHRCRGAIDVDTGLELLRLLQMPVARLHRPVR